ncbi:MAG: CbtB-domain containing protein [Rhodospirillaceae bacterium]|nr:CbtB-domain containing protein [Rhodospirillaceae bacterium]MCY4236958.1 CbtB-domain containing protein [Rhodospirillaceae bacterium]
MTINARTETRTASGLIAIAVCAFIGLAMITIAGHVQATSLHDAAHDTRHAAGFPCH